MPDAPNHGSFGGMHSRSGLRSPHLRPWLGFFDTAVRNAMVDDANTCRKRGTPRVDRPGRTARRIAQTNVVTPRPLCRTGRSSPTGRSSSKLRGRLANSSHESNPFHAMPGGKCGQWRTDYAFQSPESARAWFPPTRLRAHEPICSRLAPALGACTGKGTHQNTKRLRRLVETTQKTHWPFEVKKLAPKFRDGMFRGRK